MEEYRLEVEDDTLHIDIDDMGLSAELERALMREFKDDI